MIFILIKERVLSTIILGENCRNFGELVTNNTRKIIEK